MRGLIKPLLPLSWLITPSFCYRHFQSRNAVAQSVMEKCRAKTPDERAHCSDIVRCIMDNIPSDFPTRWNSGSSILAFIPTIVGLMSNSITEITTVAEKSTLLAILLCFCSVTSFSSRFTHELVNQIHMRHDPTNERLQAAWEDIQGMIIEQRNRDTHWWSRRKVQDAGLGLVLAALSVGVWYEVYQLSRYGVITFACPVKTDIGVWVALSQTVNLLNCLGRVFLYDVRKTQLRSTDRQEPISGQSCRTPSNRLPQKPVVILRSRRSSLMAKVLRSFTAVVSYALYIFGTVILASVNFVPASDAIRALVVLSASAGFGRLVGYWTISPLRKGEKYVFDVPPEHLEGLSQLAKSQAVVTA